MRFGVDASCWTNARGYGRYTRELLRALVVCGSADRFDVFVPAPDAASFDLQADNVRRVVVPQSVAPTRAASASGNRSLADMLRFTRAVFREAPRVFFSPSVYTYFPLPVGQRAVVTIHDTIAERYPELTLPSPRARLFWRAKVGLALRQADLILTVSEYAARDVASVLGVRPARLRISGEAPAPAFRPGSRAEAAEAAERVGVPRGGRWFTYVGGFNPHKHVDLIARCHARLAAEVDFPLHLVLVGPTSEDVFHGDQGRIRAAIRAAGTEALVHWTGFVPDEALRHLHSGALALLIPSECEGFGLPAVEAAACGTAVIATVESPLPELLAGGGLFVAPGDEQALYVAMRRLATEPATRAELSRAALARARALTWRRSAEAVLAALREVAR